MEGRRREDRVPTLTFFYYTRRCLLPNGAQRTRHRESSPKAGRAPSPSVSVGVADVGSIDWANREPWEIMKFSFVISRT
jgi:hypothetical protein